MSWSDTRRALLCAAALAPAALLAGCLRPMLAEGTAAAALRGRIALPEVEDRFGYHLYRSLEARLGEPVEPLYRLAVETRIEEKGLAITGDRAITRISLTAIADWALYRPEEEAPVAAGRVRSQSGYNSTASLFATRAVRRDIERRLARDLGERIARAVLARAESLGPPPAS